MSYSSPQDVAVNPNDKAQRYILWGNGRIDNVGGAPAAAMDTAPFFDRLDQPVAVALHITNWATGAGYVLDYQGGFQPVNGAPALGTGEGNVQVQGIPYEAFRAYVDWSWDPAGTGQGYVLDRWGALYAFGGAQAPQRLGPRWATPAARRLVMRWTPDKRAYTLDYSGGIHADWAAVSGIVGAYWPGRDIARDLAVTDWAAGRGYTLDWWGVPHPFGGAPAAHGGPYKKGADVARILHVLSAADPARFWQVWAGGQQFEYISSTPPTVTAGGVGTLSPASTVTTTTRPTLAWAYSDPQRDSQAAYQVLLFTQAFVTAHNMADPLVHEDDALAYLTGVDPAARGVVADLDLPNGSYRFYVRVQDTAGQWSGWANRGWAQNVPVPATPTGMTATPAPERWAVDLSVSIAAGGNATHVRFEASDDGGATWAPVVGAEAVRRQPTTTASDRSIPHGVTRGYRAVAFATAPRTASAPSAATFTSSGGRLTYVLTSAANPALGGEVLVVDAPGWSRTVEAAVFEPIGSQYPVVVSDGRPKARRQTLGLEADRRAEWDKIAALVESNSTLVLRDPFGDVTYCRVVGDWSREQRRLLPYRDEVTPLRHNHRTQLPLVEVAPPKATD